MTAPGTESAARHALHVEGVRFTHAGRDAFHLAIDDFVLDAGEACLLVGGSGSGKSTLLSLIAGLVDAEAGRITVAGTDIGSLDGAARDLARGRLIGMIFQTFHLLEGFSARENVETAMLFGGVPAAEQRDRADGLLADLGIDRPHAFPHELSVGQQQRVAVARALACSPALVLADEPTASLDPENTARAIDLIRTVCAKHGAALLCTSHDPTLRDRFERIVEIESLGATGSARTPETTATGGAA